MGIFGAITTAIGGLQAQSFALEHISGNIANSQTVGFKRTETSFSSLIPESPPNKQAAGGVDAFSRSTNTVQGDVTLSDTETHVAISGDGYFIVESAQGFVDGQPVFSGVDNYTRRGDFETDENGFLVNGAGYYLKGLAVDPATGNVSGSLPTIIQLSNDFLTATPTTSFEYRANLPTIPDTNNQTDGVAGSDQLDLTNVDNNGNVLGANATAFLDQSVAGGAITAFESAGAPVSVQLRWAKVADNAYNLFYLSNSSAGAADTAWTNTGLNYIFSANGQLDLAGTVNQTGTTTLTGTETLNTLGYANGDSVTIDVDGTATTHTIVDATTEDVNAVIASLTANADAAVALVGGQLQISATSPTANRVAISSSNSAGLGALGFTAGSYFLASTAAQTNNTFSALTVNDVNLGDISVDHGSGGLTQFAVDPGFVDTNRFTQNGFSAGELVGIALGDSGRLVASYTNGETVGLSEISLASFNADNELEKLDGGAYAATDDSGSAILGAQGTIIGQALEGSNTDIADEFSKLIVTQQAYSAGTRIISTADEMLTEALNMVR